MIKLEKKYHLAVIQHAVKMWVDILINANHPCKCQRLPTSFSFYMYR